MKLSRNVMFAAVLTALLSVNFALAEADPHQAFDMLKGLEGKWVRTNTQGKALEVTFRMTAGGSALLSETTARARRT